MTNLEALKSKVAGYPLSENTFLTALTDRAIQPTEEYSGKNRNFELAMADVYIVLATSVNVSEGGYQLSITDKTNFVKIAGKIYGVYGEPNPLKDDEPAISNASNLW
ncbi:hypothetical protein LX69_01141 [Breznakibacter xylanolyticus]|uniref:Uncharacterized protein n=1 Tax=Breznakibacter xylanolyticus TaxID=990 RepID=A0A2W7NN74_9BACT|nr:DUF6706 family protein [Breznakibacter xylanolyticus]PZX18104.1 hypothetical protein LX69_01141 [Breznakibacter xylanolyticus]